MGVCADEDGGFLLGFGFGVVGLGLTLVSRWGRCRWMFWEVMVGDGEMGGLSRRI